MRSCEGDDLVVAGHHHDGAELQAFGEVHGHDREAVVAGLHSFIERRCATPARRGGFGSRQLGVGAHEDRHLVGAEALVYSLLDPARYLFALCVDVRSNRDRRRHAVEHRDRSVALFGDAVDVGQLVAEQAVGLVADLVRRPVVDAQGRVERPRMSTPSAFHENGCWKMRWPRSPVKKRAFGRLPPSAARKRSWATLTSCASSTIT